MYYTQVHLKASDLTLITLRVRCQDGAQKTGKHRMNGKAVLKWLRQKDAWHSKVWEIHNVFYKLKKSYQIDRNKGQWQITEHSFYYAMTSFRIQTWLLSLTDHEMMDQEKKPTLQMYKVILQISWSAVKNIPEKNSRKKVKLFINVKSSFSEKATKSPICFDASDYYCIKVHIFWEGRKNFAKSPPQIWPLLHVQWRFC